MTVTIFSIVTAFLAIFSGVNPVAVICYYESWTAYDGVTPDNFDASLCTHVNYAFATMYNNGNIKVEDHDLDVTQGLYKETVDMKKRNSNLKVLLSVGGDADADLFKEIAASATKRKTFVNSAEQFIANYSFDGIDVDWEYPEADDKANYISLLKELKAAFEPNGWLLTAAVSSEATDHGYDFANMNKLLLHELLETIEADGNNILNANILSTNGACTLKRFIKNVFKATTYDYDFYGDWSDYTGQNSPLYASSVESDWEQENLNLAASANAWVAAGIPKSKLAIGTAFYGRSFTLRSTSDHGLHAAISGAGNDGGEAPYSTICSTYNSWTRVWDDEQKSPYKYSGNQWIGYDDTESILAKAQWIKQNGFYGVMIWAIDQDDISGTCGEAQILLKEIHKGID